MTQALGILEFLGFIRKSRIPHYIIPKTMSSSGLTRGSLYGILEFL